MQSGFAPERTVSLVTMTVERYLVEGALNIMSSMIFRANISCGSKVQVESMFEIILRITITSFSILIIHTTIIFITMLTVITATVIIIILHLIIHPIIIFIRIYTPMAAVTGIVTLS